MIMSTNSYSPKNADPLHWKTAQLPNDNTLQGRFVRLERLNVDRHGSDLWTALAGPGADHSVWLYNSYGPFENKASMDAWLQQQAKQYVMYSVVDATSGKAEGFVGFIALFSELGRVQVSIP